MTTKVQTAPPAPPGKEIKMQEVRVNLNFLLPPEYFFPDGEINQFKVSRKFQDLLATSLISMDAVKLTKENLE